MPVGGADVADVIGKELGAEVGATTERDVVVFTGSNGETRLTVVGVSGVERLWLLVRNWPDVLVLKQS